MYYWRSYLETANLEKEQHSCVQFLKFDFLLNNVRLCINIKKNYEVRIGNNGIYSANVEAVTIF
jgi:hypothetical protein